MYVYVVEHKDREEDSERRIQAPEELGKHQQGAAQLDGGESHRGECRVLPVEDLLD